MSSFVLDIEALYQRTFGSRPYKIPGMEPSDDPASPYVINGSNTTISQITGSALVDQYMGIEVWLPLYLRDLPANLFPQTTWFLPFSVVRLTGSSSYVKTPLIERRGSVKELYSVNDYNITVKGFFIDVQNRIFPESDLANLKKLHEMGDSFQADNAIINAFLNTDDRVIITGFDLPEVEGGRRHVKPFVMNLESDSVFTLELA